MLHCKTETILECFKIGTKLELEPYSYCFNDAAHVQNYLDLQQPYGILFHVWIVVILTDAIYMLSINGC